MSKISKAASQMREDEILRKYETVTNFMGGDSYRLNPLDTLKIVSSSSIFGEPQYYRSNDKSRVLYSDLYSFSHVSDADDRVLSDDLMKFRTSSEMMESVIDESLSYDYQGTLDWAVELRNNYYMRLNPQVIMVRASFHENRKKFTEENPGLFGEYENKVMKRADDAMAQLSYYIYLNKGKKNIPSILKRSIAKDLSSRSAYEVNKYKNHEIGMINSVRITHANSPVLDDLMRNGKIDLPESQLTWEVLRSEGKSWKEIYDTVTMPHMAMLRNLRGVFTEVDDAEFCKRYLSDLKKGVKNSKQFPFRYYSAMKVIKNTVEVHHAPMIMDCLEECIDISLENLPSLKGKTMALSDNSGSAWGTVTSEYGTVRVADIDNLSSTIIAAKSDEGYVGKFGDRLRTFPISKRNGILSQSEEISRDHCDDVGGATESGIWEFFKNAIDNKEHWDNIFIFSDQQAGTGNLYGTSLDMKEYRSRGYGMKGLTTYVNVFKLIKDYRRLVNPKVNVFSVQTAGYDNMILPDKAYRTDLMYGWTGKELVYADAVIKLWDEIDSRV